MKPNPWCLAVLLASCWEPAYAWIYPEHRDIALLAVEGLDSGHRALLDRLWREARTGDEARLCAPVADTGQGLAPKCIDWAALSAIGGDHSCSSRQMLQTVLGSDWILKVAAIAAQLKRDLAPIPVTAPAEQKELGAPSLAAARRRVADEASRAARQNALRTADVRMQRADPQYATRADSNLAHFMLARPDTNLDPLAYGALALKPGSELNAVGVYAWYHISALQKASRLADASLPADERDKLARAVLFDEAFALHFLEDTYASGHVAGSWGNISQRKGTHDFYNRNGLEVYTWKGRDKTIVLMGDAHMRPEDAARAAAAVRTSLGEVLDAAAGHTRGYSIPAVAAADTGPDAFDICKAVTFPDRGLDLGSGHSPYRYPLEQVLLSSPVPGLGPGLGARPRARSEVGSFVGLAASIEGRGVSGGFESSQDDNGAVPGLDLALRAGYGFEGALGDAGDGLLFFQLGFHSDGASTNRYSDKVPSDFSGKLSAAIPPRSGLSTRFRMPYYLIPGDLLILSPMYFFNPEKYSQMAVTASNGGFLGLQQGWATSIGRFQFVLGRELGVTWYGLGYNDELLAPSDTPGGLPKVVKFKSTYFDLPIIEYRPYRGYSSNQSSSLIFQLFAGADVPYGASVQFPVGAPRADLQTVWTIGLRMVFDWRYYW